MFKIAIVDDHPIFRDGLKRVLQETPDFTVCAEAQDGASATQITIQQRPDLLLLDLALPDVSGLEVLRRLREAGAGVRVLLVTAAIDRRQTIEALELGARGVLTKDAAATLLVKAIRAVLAGEYWIGRDAMADWAQYARSRTTPRLNITPRERDIIGRILDGNSNRAIARMLSVSEETVKSHISNIYSKLGVSNRMELALYISAGKLDRPK